MSNRKILLIRLHDDPFGYPNMSQPNRVCNAKNCDKTPVWSCMGDAVLIIRRMLKLKPYNDMILDCCEDHKPETEELFWIIDRQLRREAGYPV